MKRSCVWPVVFAVVSDALMLLLLLFSFQTTITTNNKKRGGRLAMRCGEKNKKKSLLSFIHPFHGKSTWQPRGGTKGINKYLPYISQKAKKASIFHSPSLSHTNVDKARYLFFPIPHCVCVCVCLCVCVLVTYHWLHCIRALAVSCMIRRSSRATKGHKWPQRVSRVLSR